MLSATFALGVTMITQTAVQPQHFKKAVTTTYEGQYLVSLPDEYKSRRGEKWPLILFLHGAGERGSEIEKVKVHGPIKEILNGRKIPAIVVAPQCPEGSWWSVPYLTALLDVVQKKYRVDLDRVYLTGLSMGGFGTFDLAISQPDRFAAIAPICGGGDNRRAWLIKDIPMWVTHGDADPTVPLQASVDMVDAIKKAGGNPKFVVVPGGGHDVWTNVYNDDAFYIWLFSNVRKPKQETRDR